MPRAWDHGEAFREREEAKNDRAAAGQLAASRTDSPPLSVSDRKTAEHVDVAAPSAVRAGEAVGGEKKESIGTVARPFASEGQIGTSLARDKNPLLAPNALVQGANVVAKYPQGVSWSQHAPVARHRHQTSANAETSHETNAGSSSSAPPYPLALAVIPALDLAALQTAIQEFFAGFSRLDVTACESHLGLWYTSGILAGAAVAAEIARRQARLMESGSPHGVDWLLLRRGFSNE
jgi:hypothetical protein